MNRRVKRTFGSSVRTGLLTSLGTSLGTFWGTPLGAGLVVGSFGLASGSGCGGPTDEALEPATATGQVGSLEQALTGRPPALSKVEPALGPDIGLITVTLTGKNFRPGSTVTFGGVAASGVRVVSSTQITATLPSKPGSLGRVPVRITQPDGRYSERTDLFAYYSDELVFDVPYRLRAPSASDVVVADLNKDGKLDVLVDRKSVV